MAIEGMEDPDLEEAERTRDALAHFAAAVLLAVDSETCEPSSHGFGCVAYQWLGERVCEEAQKLRAAGVTWEQFT